MHEQLPKGWKACYAAQRYGHFPHLTIPPNDEKSGAMSAVGDTPNGLEFIRISSHIPKNIQEGSADIIFENNDILSHPREGSGKNSANPQVSFGKSS